MKKQIIVVLILVSIYSLSFYGAYKFIQKAHYDEKGRWNNSPTIPADIFMTVAPVFNTFLTVHYLFGGWRRQTEGDIKTTFFKPKQQNL